MSDLPINLMMSCVVVILLAAVGTWWLKGEGEKEWRRHRAAMFWADIQKLREGITRMAASFERMKVAAEGVTTALRRSARLYEEHPELWYGRWTDDEEQR